MVKAAGSLCNMNCRYCYYLNNQTSRNQFMSEGTLEKLIRNYFSSYGGPVFSIIWHGGEPTLRGIDFYRKAVELEKKYLPEGAECWNNLQSNGLELDEEWCRFLKQNRFDVGISIDGSKTIHERYRHGGSYEDIVRNIRMLQQKTAPGACIRVLAPLEDVPGRNETMRLLEEKIAGDDCVKIVDLYAEYAKEGTSALEKYFLAEIKTLF